MVTNDIEGALGTEKRGSHIIGRRERARSLGKERGSWIPGIPGGERSEDAKSKWRSQDSSGPMLASDSSIRSEKSNSFASWPANRANFENNRRKLGSLFYS